MYKIIYFKKLLPFIIICATTSMSGCASMTPTLETTEQYAIYDIKPSHTATTLTISGAIKVALQKNMSGVQIETSIPPYPTPKYPGRFKLVDPLAHSNFSALAAMSGHSFKTPMCENAVFTARSQNSTLRKYGEGTQFFLCLLPYQEGYNLDIYITYKKYSGALNPAILGATLARTVVGDSSKFIPRTIDQILENIKKTGAKIKLLDSR